MATLQPAVQTFLDATEAGDYDLFLTAFASDAVLEDWGRTFVGHEGIDRWDRQEHIGTQNTIVVRNSFETGDTTTLAVSVSGNGYNGDGTFVIHVRDGLIASFIIN